MQNCFTGTVGNIRCLGISLLIFDNLLHCISQSSDVLIINDQYFDAAILKQAHDVGFESGRRYQESTGEKMDRVLQKRIMSFHFINERPNQCVFPLV